MRRIAKILRTTYPLVLHRHCRKSSTSAHLVAIRPFTGVNHCCISVKGNERQSCPHTQVSVLVIDEIRTMSSFGNLTNIVVWGSNSNKFAFVPALTARALPLPPPAKVHR